MKQETVHIIQKTVVDFHFNGTIDGFALQKEVKDWFDDFIAGLSTQFNEIVGDDEMISIDSLELKIDISNKHWKEDATKKILFQIQDKIMLLQSGSVATKQFRKIVLAKHWEEEFLFYLRHGYLSWKSSTVPAKEWKQSANIFFETAGKAFAEKLLSEMKVNRNTILRLKGFVSSSLLLHVLSALFSNDAAYQKVSHDFTLLHQTIKTKKAGEDDIVISFLNIVSQWPVHSYAEHAVANLLELLITEKIADKKEIQSASFQSAIFIQQQERITNNQQKETTERRKSKIENRQVVKAEKITDHSNNQTVQELSETDEIFISNAGLVIVAAFLPAFFERMKLYDGNTIRNHTHAVCLLHYIATGEKPTDEFELVLPKILCGLEPETVIHVKDFSVQKKWKKETEDVLTSAIEYWNVLGNTSVEGLRESFLQRKGKLSNNGNGWNLQVEQQSYDMLLQHLPWSISMIQLPWMKQILKTEWIY